MDNKLAGAMFWSIDSDDFKGNHCDQGKYPLVNSVKKIFESMSQFETDDEFIQTSPTTSTATTTTSTSLTTTTTTTSTTTTSTTTTTTTTITPSTTTTSISISTTLIPELLLDYFDEDTNSIPSASLNAKIETPKTDTNFITDDDKEVLVKNILGLEQDEPITPTSTATTAASNMNTLNVIMKKINMKKDETLRKLKSKIESKQRIFKLSNTSINKKPLIFTTTTISTTTSTTTQESFKQTSASFNINPLEQLSQIQKAQLLTNMFRFSIPQKIKAAAAVKQSSATSVQDRIDQAYRNGFNDSYTCIFDGLYADKSSGCVIFYECVWTNTRYAKKQLRVCPQGTIFNQNINVCDWEFNTVC